MTSTITEMALAISRGFELSILGKATILLVMGLTAAWVAGRARASVRHLLLAATFATLLALPLIVATAPGVAIAVPVSGTMDTIAIPSPGAFVTSTSGPALGALARDDWRVPSWPVLMRWGWISGAMLLFASLVLDLWRLNRLRRNGLPWPEMLGPVQSLAAQSGVRRPVEVLLHENIAAPITCGMWHPAIVLPADAREWNPADLRRALVHELEHVRRGDWAIQLASRAACAAYWFHPLVWVAWRRLCLEAERACDDAAVQSTDRTEYAEQLVSLARRLSHAHAQPALGMANRGDLSARVSAILDGRQRRGRAGLLAVVSAAIVASMVVLAIGPVRAVAQSATRRVSALDRALYEAAKSGDLPDMTALLNAGANVNGKIGGDGSPLIGAARKGHMAAVRFLLDRGADVNMPVHGDGNPLIMAANRGNAEVVSLLLDRGASINQIVEGDENALINASGNGHLNVVKLLVERGADVNARVWVAVSGGTSEWRTPLSRARKGRHDAVVAFLVAAGARE